MRTSTRVGVYCGALTALLGVVVVGSATVGPVDIAPLAVAKATLNVFGVPAGLDVGLGTASLLGRPVPVPAVDVSYFRPFSFGVSPVTETIVTEIRLPRILLGAVVGFALGAAGTVMQGFFRNPMADPSIIGVSSGAAVGAVATIALPLALPFGLQTAAFVGALAAAFGVYLIATEGGRTPVATLLLAGVAVQTFLGAVISYLLLHAGRSVEEALFWLMGNLADSRWAEVEVTAVVTLVVFLGIYAYAHDMNVLLLGESDAQTVGIRVERTKRVLLALSSVVTAGAVAVAGVIGFVGLIVPHILRLLVGPDHRVLLPTSALGGAVFLVATDTVARAGAAELPVGIVTAALGAPFFLFLLRRREVHEL
ncbi:vitamin B12 ABC transporter permease BtuC [Halapricum sp. CBA1109]|uniref:vitamin B12 ABC transporter permease BtuC n=1 Tax=Halapricum sp. CBA1109 TaxID=2668068 RepID=UPI0012FA523E|nr:vitamin B12 ABC transporter permease BtuC [Halapricum sp. CBA1109]MUV89956.1 vitamin B12 ABC transporter permease BtuC [Halapricum sp. CBA1109]